MYSLSQAVVVHAFDPSTQEAEAGGSLQVQGPSALQSKVLYNEDYTEKPCLEKENKQKMQKQNKDMV